MSISIKVARSIQAAGIIRQCGFKVVSPITEVSYEENNDVTAGTSELFFADGIDREQTSGGLYIGFPPFQIQVAKPGYSTIATLRGCLEIGSNAMLPTTLHLYGDPDDSVNNLITALAKWKDELKVQKSAEKASKIFYRSADTE